MNEFLYAVKNYAQFYGRARRREYWMFSLFYGLFALIPAILDYMLGLIGKDTGIGVLSTIYGLALLIPSIAVTVRRLHDTTRSGWWYLINFVPIAGPLVMFIFVVLDSDAGSNKWGDNPKQLSNTYSNYSNRF